MNVYEGSLVATGLKVGVVVSRFNSLITAIVTSDAFLKTGKGICVFGRGDAGSHSVLDLGEL